MNKLRKVERLRELARSDQAKTVARERQEVDDVAGAFAGVGELVQEYRHQAADANDISQMRLQRRFFGELYKTYLAQGERLAAKERALNSEIGELEQRHKSLTLLRNVLKKREEAHTYAARKKAARAQIHRAKSKL